jgi:hypothetical protein
MELSTNEEYAANAALVLCLLVGVVTRRAALALIPLLGLVGFSAYVFSSDDRYNQVSEELQIAVIFALGFGSILVVIGALARRAIDSERRRRARAS